MEGQSLRGFVGQGMDARKDTFDGDLHVFAPGNHSFRAPKAGFWIFAVWGAGGAASNGAGGGGAFCLKTIYLSPGSNVALVVAHPGFGASTLTFQSGAVLSAGGGQTGSSSPGLGGVANGGDINVDGAPGVGTTGGAAGSSGQYRGGSGGTNGAAGRSPGGGSGGFSGTGIQVMAGSGLILATYARP